MNSSSILRQMTMRERFFNNTKVGNSVDCWEWLGLKDSLGYGIFKYRYKRIRASRIAWSIINGDFPVGKIACHTCDNVSCVNPYHIFAGTDKDNKDDCVTKGRHALGERCGNSTLTESQVIAIRRHPRRWGYMMKLSRDLGVSYSTIKKIVSRRSWKHVK